MIARTEKLSLDEEDPDEIMQLTRKSKIKDKN